MGTSAPNERMIVLDGDGKGKKIIPITSSPQATFNEVLKKAKIPLAE